jgi:hypothetical protein
LLTVVSVKPQETKDKTKVDAGKRKLKVKVENDDRLSALLCLG